MTGSAGRERWAAPQLFELGMQRGEAGIGVSRLPRTQVFAEAKEQ